MSRISGALFAIVLLLSGASALTYEVLWQRQMFLIFGASAPATTAILTAIFLGIAFGSFLIQRIGAGGNSPLLLYAALEAVLAVWGLLVPWTLQLSDSVYVSTVAAVGEGHGLQPPARFVLALLPLLPATLAMGATIPVMVRCMQAYSTRAAAVAYGINILGAVAGGLLTGFVWMRWFGIHDSRLAAVGCNAAAALLLAALHFVQPAAAISTAAVPAPASGARPAGVIPLYFVSGFVALGLEVVWLRFLGIVNSNSTTTFTLALATYLAGMGLGSLLAYPCLRRFASPRTIFALGNGGAACAALLTFPVLYQAAVWNHEWISAAAREGALAWNDVVRTEALIAAALMLLPALFLGVVYPAVCEMFEANGPEQDRWVAQSYFVGTLGSVAGILLVAMALIPAVGLHGAFAMLAALSLAVCIASEFASVEARRRRMLTTAACIALGVWGASVALEARPVLRETIAIDRRGAWVEVLPSGDGRILSELVHVNAGPTATVMVKKEVYAPDRLIYVDDQLVASTNLEARVDALMLAHLPLLLHDDPRSALTVGFGTGGTSHAMTTHGVDTWCVEIEPEVPAAAELLRQQNFGVLDHPRFTLLINDARDHLHAGQRSYDVIATDVTNLQYKQNGNLYTVEYFRLMQEKLNPGGVACAWIPLAAISTDELRILMQSFRRVFPHATLWYMNHTFTNFGILIGTEQPLAVDYRRLQQGFRDNRIADSLRLVGMVEPLQLAHCLHLDEAGYKAFCGDAPLHTDDHPILEFSSPHSYHRYFDTFHDNLEATLALRPRDLRGFVSQAPAETSDDFTRHSDAAHHFCQVVLLMHREKLSRERGDAVLAESSREAAAGHARAGLAAWPDDHGRRRIYEGFLGRDWQRRTAAQ